MDWTSLLEQVAAGQPCLAAGDGTRISGTMVSELLKAARADGNRPVLQKADFTGVVFEDAGDFTNTRFEGEARFKGATFEGACRFSLAEFVGRGDFRGVTFVGDAIFEHLGPAGRLDFQSARFGPYCSFGPLQANHVEFSLAHFAGQAVFSDFRIEGFLNFVGTRFSEPVWHFNVRKGREDSKNEPGAADFYYGEMEMRRHGSAPVGERLLLWLYWLISGYSLRPLRTLVTLVAVWLLFAELFIIGGFMQPVAFPFSRALQVSIASTVSLNVVSDQAFSSFGNWLRIPLRILGPMLYGLLALAIRGRIKR